MGKMALSLRLRYLPMKLIVNPSIKLAVYLSQVNKRPYIHIEMPSPLGRELLIQKMVRVEYELPTHSIKIFPCNAEDEAIMGYPIKQIKMDGKYSICFDLPARPYGVRHPKKPYTPIARREKNYLWVKL